MNYLPTSEFIAWFEREVPDPTMATKMCRRLDDAIADRKPVVTVMEWQKLAASKENIERDQMRCDAIRAQEYVASQRVRLEKDLRGFRTAIKWLTACASFIGWMWRAR